MAEQCLDAAAPISDRDLLRAVAGGDQQALRQLYALHGPCVLAYLMGQLGDRSLAEEVLQDVMLAVWNGAARFRGDSKVRTWLLAIARNQAISARRKRRVRLVALDEALPDSDGHGRPGRWMIGPRVLTCVRRCGSCRPNSERRWNWCSIMDYRDRKRHAYWVSPTGRSRAGSIGPGWRSGV